MDDLVATVGSDESAVKRRRIETLENLENQCMEHRKIWDTGQNIAVHITSMIICTNYKENNNIGWILIMRWIQKTCE